MLVTIVAAWLLFVTTSISGNPHARPRATLALWNRLRTRRRDIRSRFVLPTQLCSPDLLSPLQWCGRRAKNREIDEANRGIRGFAGTLRFQSSGFCVSTRCISAARCAADRVVGQRGLWRGRHRLLDRLPVRADSAAKSARQRSDLRKRAARRGRDARRSRRCTLLPLSIRGGGVRDYRDRRDRPLTGASRCAARRVAGFRISGRAICSLYLPCFHRRGVPAAWNLRVVYRRRIGAALANRWMRAKLASSRKTSRRTAGAIGVIVLDAMLLIAIGGEVVSRLSAPPMASPIVAALSRLTRNSARRNHREQHLVSVSAALHPGNRSPVRRTQLVRSGRELHRLPSESIVRETTQGWTSPIPPTLFVGDSDFAASRSIARHKSAK